MIEEFHHQVTNLTDNQTETECDDLCIEYKVGYWIEGVIIPIIAIFGILGKILLFLYQTCPNCLVSILLILKIDDMKGSIKSIW